MPNKIRQSYLAMPYVVWVLICTILPLLFILGYALTTSDGAFTLGNMLSIFEKIH